MSGRFHETRRHSSLHGLRLVIAWLTVLACSGATEPTPTAIRFNPTVALSISPPRLNLIVGGEGLLSGRAFDAMDRTTIASFEWLSEDPAIATVGKTDGVVTAIAAGTTTVMVTSGALSATATVLVRPLDPPVAVAISPSAVSLIVGGAERLVARASDSTGLTTIVSFEWSSADPAVATVGTSDGIVTAISSGVTTVTAAVGALRATATVSVIEFSFARSFSFTRMTQSGTGSFSSDVLSYSVADRTMRSLAASGPFASIGAPAWSTDGTRLAVEVIHGFVAGCPWPEINSDLYVLDAEAPPDSPWRALTANGLSKSPSWSPDGKRIAFLHQPALFANNHIYILDVAGGAPVRLTQTEGWYSGPRWSPDGTRLAFTDWNVGNGDVFIVNADGSGLINVTGNSAMDVDPSWSPDGVRLAFVSDRHDPAYHSDVFVVDVNGSNVNRLTSLYSYSGGPAWSPDGRQIMFSSGTGLYVMNADGSAPVRVTTPPLNSWDSAPAWRR